ncbi:hypothetical protein [Ruegeria sp. SCP11]|uniref:hypothetical protein n=1 Tax=Ruegeria sp. SCP11 TaxID=3141378 RepID=UPI00333A3572
MSMTARRANTAAHSIQKVETFFTTYNAAVKETPAVADFTFGNPHEMPLPSVVDALKTHAEPQSVDWFAYKTNEADPCALLADALSQELGLPFEAEDIALTKGAFGPSRCVSPCFLSPETNAS